MCSFSGWITNLAKDCFRESLRYGCIISRGGTSDLPQKERPFKNIYIIKDRNGPLQSIKDNNNDRSITVEAIKNLKKKCLVESYLPLLLLPCFDMIFCFIHKKIICFVSFPYFDYFRPNSGFRNLDILCGFMT